MRIYKDEKSGKIKLESDVFGFVWTLDKDTMDRHNRRPHHFTFYPTIGGVVHISRHGTGGIEQDAIEVYVSYDDVRRVGDEVFRCEWRSEQVLDFPFGEISGSLGLLQDFLVEDDGELFFDWYGNAGNKNGARVEFVFRPVGDLHVAVPGVYILDIGDARVMLQRLSWTTFRASRYVKDKGLGGRYVPSGEVMITADQKKLDEMEVLLERFVGKK